MAKRKNGATKSTRRERVDSRMSHVESRNFKRQKHREMEDMLVDDMEDYLSDHRF
jgi:hypothetical protein